MEFLKITLLKEEEYAKYKSIIPDATAWWFKTPHPEYADRVRVVDNFGRVNDVSCFMSLGGVRPLCIFNLKTSDPLFWHKSKGLVGSKIEYGKYNWTILNIENGKLLALCDNIIAYRRFDKSTNVWERSELKMWLETEGFKLITS